MPQSIDPVTEVPHPTPSFVVASIPDYLLKPVLPLYRQGSADAAATPPCHCKLELQIPYVEEQDPTVTLEVRWFVDYDPKVPGSLRPWSTVRLNGDFDTSGTIRPLLQRFDFDADTFGITTNGTHTVDVVVAEAVAYLSPTSGKAVSPEYNRSEYRFVVEATVDADPARPACPSNLPSIRVCE